MKNQENSEFIETGSKNKNDSKEISSLFTEYCNSSSIHGVRYIGNFDKPFYQRYTKFVFGN